MMTGLGGIISELNSTGAPLSALFLSFIVFSFIGWLYESTICALANYGHFANSGFLLGPCCPIYGVGSLACWFLLRDIPSVAVQFAAAALVCSAIEYGVGAALEQTTGARFWDYSKFPLQHQWQGLPYGAALFGAGAVFICRIAEPALLNALERIPPTILAAAAFACAALLAIDTAFTLVSWRQLSQSSSRSESNSPTKSTNPSKMLPTPCSTGCPTRHWILQRRSRPEAENSIHGSPRCRMAPSRSCAARWRCPRS